MLGGVAGGMAEYANFDVTLMRLIWVLALFSGIGILAYIICWIIIPEVPFGNEQYTNNNPGAVDNQADRRRNVGLFLIGIGLLFLIKNLIPWHFWEKAWPLLLVALGLYILLSYRKGDQV